jgi:hypothetical protein
MLMPVLLLISITIVFLLNRMLMKIRLAVTNYWKEETGVKSKMNERPIARNAKDLSLRIITDVEESDYYYYEEEEGEEKEEDETESLIKQEVVAGTSNQEKTDSILRRSLIGSAKKMLFQCIFSFLLLMQILYEDIAERIISVFTCSRAADGAWYMNDNAYIRCWEFSVSGGYSQSVWALLFYTSLVCMVVYIIGVPVTFFCLVLRTKYLQQQRQLMQDQQQQQQQDEKEKDNDDEEEEMKKKATTTTEVKVLTDAKLEQLAWVEWLYEDYRDSCWMWTFVNLGQQLLIAILGVVFPPGSGYQPVAVISVFVFFILLMESVKPFRSNLENRIFSTSYGVVIVVYCCTLVMNIVGGAEKAGADVSVSSYSVIQWYGEVLSVGMLMVFLLLLLKPTWQRLAKIFLAYI